MNPGLRTRPPASITRAAVGTGPASSRDTPAMRPPSTTTEPANGGAPLPSMIRACATTRRSWLTPGASPRRASAEEGAGRQARGGQQEGEHEQPGDEDGEPHVVGDDPL